MARSRDASLAPSRATSRTRSSSGSSTTPRVDRNRLYAAKFMDDQAIYSSQGRVVPQKREDNFGNEKKDAGDSTSTIESAPDTGDDEHEEQDIEAGSPSKESPEQDPNLVTWDGPTDPLNPKNWSFKSKWVATFVVSSFTFISPVSSSMIAPALGKISEDLHISSRVEAQLSLSIYVLAYGIGPLFMGPLSEIYGRVVVLHLANLFNFIWNTGCAAAQTKNQLILFRFLSGVGGSAPLAVGGGLLSDCWRAEERGRAISIYSLAPLLGPAVGPIAGSFIAERTSWRWCFWSTSIVTALIQIGGFLFLRETYGPKILKQKAERLRKETGNKALYTEAEAAMSNISIFSLLKTNFSRPFRLLFTQPIVQVLSCYIGYIYGLLYLVLSTFPDLWEQRYGESIGIGGLNYISMGIGFFIGAQFCAPINDTIYRKLKKRYGGVGRPEFRMPLMLPGGILVPVGLFWYGWSAQAHAHWIVPNIGAAIFCTGMIIEFQCIQTYLVDAYSRYAASAVGAATVLRSIAAFAFPLFGPSMYSALDYGWGNSLLAFVAITVGLPAPVLLWLYGEKLRGKSRFAAGGSND